MTNDASSGFSSEKTYTHLMDFGNGGAAKEQVAYLLAAELRIDVSRIPLDSTDALSLAICHAQRHFHPELGKLGKSV